MTLLLNINNSSGYNTSTCSWMIINDNLHVHLYLSYTSTCYTISKVLQQLFRLQYNSMIVDDNHHLHLHLYLSYTSTCHTISKVLRQLFWLQYNMFVDDNHHLHVHLYLSYTSTCHTIWQFSATPQSTIHVH